MLAGIFLSELGDGVQADEKATIDEAIAELKEALTGDDKDAIEAKTQKLSEASSKLAERLYAQKGAEGAVSSGGGTGGPPTT